MSYPGVLHEYSPDKVAFEFSPTGHKNTVLFIGGLDDGFLTVPYVPTVAKDLTQRDWSVIQIQMTSSFKGWGLSSLDQDIKEIRTLVEYLRSEKGGSRDKIVLFGHSTGSQDTIHYLLNYGDTVDGGILQASASDREAYTMTIGKDKERLDIGAREMVLKGEADQLLPLEYSKHVFNTPISAYRWCSLMLPGGDDDYFSSDLTSEVLEKTFGKISKPFLIAFSECDQYVPEEIDKAKLLRGWKECSNPSYWSKNSGLIKGASHKVDSDESQQFLCLMVNNFLDEFHF